VASRAGTPGHQAARTIRAARVVAPDCVRRPSRRAARVVAPDCVRRPSRRAAIPAYQRCFSKVPDSTSLREVVIPLGVEAVFASGSASTW